jgi:23S rRNA (cytosine1962-C5)-methyltransferase
VSLGALVGDAIERRSSLLRRLAEEETDCARLFHGVVEGRPGLTIDRYGPVLLVQTWAAPLADVELREIAAAVERGLGEALAICWNHRGDGEGGAVAEDARLEAPIGREMGARFDVRPRHRGQDPLLFLDLRAGRRWVRGASRGRSVLNVFAYTCGIGVAAALGGAREVWNVDFARSALEVGAANARRNGIDPQGATFRLVEGDAIPVLRQLAGLGVKGRGRRRPHGRFEQRTFDLVVLDPPRFAKTPFGAIDVVRDYPSLFKPALLACAKGGAVLATNHVPAVAIEDWARVLARTAEKIGRAIEIETISPEEDFPSPDGRPPLKIAIARQRS